MHCNSLTSLIIFLQKEELTDFDRFKLYKLKQRVNKIVQKKFERLRAKAKRDAKAARPKPTPKNKDATAKRNKKKKVKRTKSKEAKAKK